MNIKKTTTLGLSLVFALGAAACGSDDDGGGGSDATSATGPIKIWLSNNPEEIAWGEKMVDAWNAEHPDEEVTAQEIPAGKSSEEVIGAAITAGNAPCLVFNTSPAAVPQFQKQGGLVPLDSFPDGKEYVEARTGEAAEQYQSSDGSYYQLPWKANPVMIFYNKDMMKKAGVDPENPPLATYDEFLDDQREDRVQRCRRGRDLAGSLQRVLPVVVRLLPPVRRRDGRHAARRGREGDVQHARGPGGRRVLEDDVRRGVLAEREVQRRLLRRREGRHGDRRPVGHRRVRREHQLGRRSGPDLRRHRRAEETYTFSDAKNVAIYSACEAQGTAWEVLKFATSEEQDGSLLENTGQMPMRDGVEAAYPDYFKANPDYTTFAAQAARTVEVPNVANSIEIWQTFRDEYSESVIFGESEIADALAAAAAEVDNLASQE